MVASGGLDGNLRLWDIKTGAHLRTINTQSENVERSPVLGVSISPNGSIVASGSADKTIRLWDIKTGEHLRTLVEHKGSVRCVTFSPDGSMVASGSGDIRLWDMKTGAHLRTLTGHWKVYNIHLLQS